MGNTRARNFATIVYPDSAPKDWMEIMRDKHIPTMISPLHDSDIGKDGTLLKAHYHVIVQYETLKTQAQAKQVFDEIGGVGCEVVQSVRAYSRYLIHMDDPDKYQYSKDDVVCLSGANYGQMIDLASSKYVAIGEMMDYCQDNRITSYARLIEYARHNRPDWFKVLCDSATIVIRSYLQSRRDPDISIYAEDMKKRFEAMSGDGQFE